MPPENVTLASIARDLSDHVRECTGVRNDTRRDMADLKNSLATLSGNIAEIKATPMRAVRWLGGIIIAAAVAAGIQNYLLHQETTQQAAVAAQQATVAAEQTSRIAKAVGAP